MQHYFTMTQLLGLRTSNLPPQREVRFQRYQSVRKMMDLIQIAQKTRPNPGFPTQMVILNEDDPEWDDAMPFPALDYPRYVKLGISIGTVLAFYSYNFNLFHNNIKFRSFRLFFPFAVAIAFTTGYTNYRRQILKINLFDEYCYLRAYELINQNQYLIKSQDFQKTVWWHEDFKDTMQKVYRQGNSNDPSDFKDSELILQDFINRYVDPDAKSPMKDFCQN